MNIPQHPQPASPLVGGKLDQLRRFARENGSLLLLRRIAGAALRRSRDRVLARRLATSGLRLGRFPRILGLTHMRLGRDISAGDNLWIEAVTHFAGHTFSPRIEIGDRCSLSDRVHIAATHSVVLLEDVLCGSNVLITDHAHGTYTGAGPHSDPSTPPNLRRLSTSKSVHIGRNVWIGDNASILGGAHIGDGAVIGANSVVTGNIPPQTIAIGAPARPIRAWNPDLQQWIPL